MKNSVGSILALSLTFAVPNPVFADLKDVAIGAAIGAVITQGINSTKKKTAPAASQKKSKSYSNKAPGLNGQFNRTERRQIQTSLNGLGLNVGVVDGSLGPKSRSAISQFQGTRGEAQTGQLTREQFIALTGVGFATLPAIAPDRRLAQNEVVMMQQSLQRIGFYNGPVDGVDGQGTQNARSGFLVSRNLNAVQTTQVQSLVLAASAAGFQAPPYLVQEAQAQYAAVTNSQPFGTAPPAPQGTLAFGAQPQQLNPNGQFGTPAATGGFGAQPQQNNGFGAQAPVGAAQPAPLFGAAPQQQQQLQVTPQQQQIQAAPQQQLLFAPSQQPQPLQAPVQQQPAQQGQALFAATGTTAAQPQQQPQSSLDVFSLPKTQPQSAVQQSPTAVVPATTQQVLQAE